MLIIFILYIFCLPLFFIPSTTSQQVPINTQISTKNNFDTSKIFQLTPNNKYQSEWKRKVVEMLRRNYLIKTARKMKIKNKEDTKSAESLKAAIKGILMGIYN